MHEISHVCNLVRATFAIGILDVLVESKIRGAVIAGMLILLSITQKTTVNQFVGVNTLTQLLGHSLFTVLTTTIVYPFAVSAIIGAIENKRGQFSKIWYKNNGSRVCILDYNAISCRVFPVLIMGMKTDLWKLKVEGRQVICSLYKQLQAES